jgi:tetratricopeptide (TPR) repeat protein
MFLKGWRLTPGARGWALGAGGCLVLLPSLVGAAQQADARMLRVERWLKAIVYHEPGAIDEAVVEIASWSSSDLRTFWFDSTALELLMREPNVNLIQAPTPRQRRSEPPRTQTVRYTPWQLQRLRVFACAAAGIAGERYCLGIKALGQLDEDLRRLAQLSAEARFKGDLNYTLKRGALLHTDVAMVAGGQPLDRTAANAGGGPDRLRIDISDGRDTGAVQELIHWDIARSLLDAVRPSGDPMVRLWYHATAAWMQAQGLHDSSDHLEYGLRLFPRDPDLLFLSGCEHEAIARPAIQAAVRGVDLPAGFEMTIGSVASELRQAESFLRQALTANPDLVEARIRLGRVLILRGRHREAADELHRVAPALGEDLLDYFAALFLGEAEEGLGNYDRADMAYARASEIFPTAQSPHLARSALARRRGERAGALAGLERAFALANSRPEFAGVSDADDPWWTYDYAQGRNASALLDRLWQPFRQVQP